MFRRILGGFILLLLATSCAGETSTGERAYARGDYFSAAAAFRTAAGKGDGRAQKRLGDMYADGVGVPQNYTEAIKWYCMAAEQGYEPSIARLYALGFAGRPGAYETTHLKAACAPVLYPPPEVEAAERTDKETRSKDVRVTIRRYTTTDDYSTARFRYYYPYPHRWRPIKPRPPAHRPDFPRPPLAMPTPKPR
jgi:hypothetical protein